MPAQNEQRRRLILEKAVTRDDATNAT